MIRITFGRGSSVGAVGALQASSTSAGRATASGVLPVSITTPLYRDAAGDGESLIVGRMLLRSLLLGSLAAGPVASLTAQDALVVVAPERFAKTLAQYVAHRAQELPCRLLLLEPALEGEQGRDDAERLKRRLFDEWRERGARYVLLVGDADVLPVRYMVLDRNTAAAFDYAFYPSDLYYGDVARADGTFDDWNAAADDFHAGYFGEVRGEHNKTDPINFDRVDYRPELAVGRWPVSDEEELRRIVRKTIAHDR